MAHFEVWEILSRRHDVTADRRLDGQISWSPTQHRWIG
jgi:hypothetical protein